MVPADHDPDRAAHVGARRRSRAHRRAGDGGRLRRRVVQVATVIALATAGCRAADPPAVVVDPVGGDGTCLYTGHLIDRFVEFEELVGRSIDCAVVFNNAAPTWPELTRPWFIAHADPNRNWADWKRADPERRLIISQSLVPDDVSPQWRREGADGEHEVHARALATNLVRAGLGDSVIRLSHEANGTWTKDGLGPDRSQFAVWRDAWRRFALAMASVPGAAFQFDWTINPGVRPIPFDDYYPGDDVVDIIGVDLYDYWEDERFGPEPVDPQRRWDVRFAEPVGAAELIEFAARHGKPLSIPEWALRAPGVKGGAGDNPSFVDNVARIVRDHPVAYHAYFEKSADILLADSPVSLAAYREAFARPVEGSQ